MLLCELRIGPGDNNVIIGSSQNGLSFKLQVVWELLQYRPDSLGIIGIQDDLPNYPLKL